MKVKLTHPPTLRNRAASICCLSVSLFSMHMCIFLNIFDVALSRGGKKGWDPCLGRGGSGCASQVSLGTSEEVKRHQGVWSWNCWQDHN